MILTYPCYSVIIKRKAITKPWVIDEMIRNGRLEECRYDENLVTFLVGMNPIDAEDGINYLNEKLGIEIYDMSNPKKPHSKDGMLWASPFGGAGGGWLVREGDRMSHLLSYFPEEKRTIPREEIMKHRRTCVRDFGFFDKGAHLMIMKGIEECYLHYHYDYLLPKKYQTDEEACKAMTEKDVLSIMAKNGISLVPDFVERDHGQLLVDYGDYNGWKLCLISDICKRLSLTYKNMKIEISKTLGDENSVTRDDVISILEKTLDEYRKKEELKNAHKSQVPHIPIIPRKMNGFHLDLGQYRGKPVTLEEGRYGIYLKCGKENYRIPRDCQQDEELAKKKITLEEAISIIKA